MENFGKLGKDRITNFEGIITGKCKYIYGCSQYMLTPKIDKDGKRMPAEWFDEGRVLISDVIVEPEKVKAKENGCEYREHPSN